MHLGRRELTEPVHQIGQAGFDRAGVGRRDVVGRNEEPEHTIGQRDHQRGRRAPVGHVPRLVEPEAP